MSSRKTQFVTSSESDTEKKAAELIKGLGAGQIVFLQGNLGAGKTTYAKGAARELGITTRILSPTFTLLRTHDVKKESYIKKGIKKLYHLDLYRLKGNDQSITETVSELHKKKDGVIFIEWPDSKIDLTPDWKVSIKAEDNKRLFTITKTKE